MLESLALLARQLVIIFYCDKSLTVNQHVLIIPVTKQESYSNAACCQKKKERAKPTQNMKKLRNVIQQSLLIKLIQCKDWSLNLCPPFLILNLK